MDLKDSLNHVVSRHTAIHFVVPHIECGQSRLNIILKGPRIFRWRMNIGFSLKSPAALAPKMSIILCFEALKLEALISFLALKVLDGIFLQDKTVLSTVKNLLCS